MYELIQLAQNSFYMDCPAKVGFYKIGENEVVLIDSGSDKDAGKKVKRILDANGWMLRAIYNTHSHADHIGGNQYLQGQTGCKIYALGVERCFTEYPILEPTSLLGGHSLPELRNKFLMAKESVVEKLAEECLPKGLELLRLPGHSYDMVGFKTADGVIFLADSLSGADTIQKYQISYLYDVQAYLDTLERLKTLQAALFVPSHAEVTDNIIPLSQLNIDKTKETAAHITRLLSAPKTFEELLSEVFTCFGLSMTTQQYALIGSTVRSYLSYLYENGVIRFFFEDNRMLWQANQI